MMTLFYSFGKQEHGGRQGASHLHYATKRIIVAFLVVFALQTLIQQFIDIVSIGTVRNIIIHHHHGGELFHRSSVDHHHHHLKSGIYSKAQPPLSSSSWTEALLDDLHTNPTNNNDDAIYTISNQIRNEYFQWHYNVQQLSQIELEPSIWTPTIQNWSNHSQLRSHRFPSISERVQYYMGPWYNASTAISMYGPTFQNDVHIHQMSTRKYGPYSSLLVNLYNLNRDALYDCYQNKKELQVFSPYCRDYIDVAILHAEGTANIMHYIGDGLPYMRKEMRKYPLFAKVRPICDGTVNELCEPNKRVDSILLPLNRKRHYGIASSVPLNDIPWEQKIGKAIWRGKYGDITPNASTNDHIKYALVSKHLNSTVVDARFSKSVEHAPKVMIGQYMDMKAQLAYKYVISIEGNDISSGLKWMLFSNSVVFAPPFTMSSWAMEDTLQPFVHYIPIKRDMSNVESMVQWAESHPDETKLISERSTLFMYDLLFHPEAMEDERQIMIQMIERYEQNFGYYDEWKRHQSTIQVNWGKHPSDRRDRFPSVDERVQYAMGKWYHHQNDVHDALSIQRMRSNLNSLSRSLPWNDDIIPIDSLFLASGHQLSVCATQNSTTSAVRQFCKVSLPYFDERNTADLKSNSFHRLRKSKIGMDLRFANVSSWRRKAKLSKDSKRVLLDDSMKAICYGNCARTGRMLDVPYFAGYRHRNDEHAILWPFVDYTSSLKMATMVWRENLDTTFEDKIPRAIVRHGIEILSTNDSSMLVDVARKSSNQEHMHDMISYRYLLVIDESGVNEDLLWMLRSTSVVLMPMPSHRNVSSWLMEDFLQPFVHFVPIAPDYSDIDEQIRWCENNSDDVKLISERATLFVYDMLLDRNSEKENEEVKYQVLKRYASIYGSH